jgi:hypothetical protein
MSIVPLPEMGTLYHGLFINLKVNAGALEDRPSSLAISAGRQYTIYSGGRNE